MFQQEPDEMGLSSVKGGHEVVELVLVEGGHRLAAPLLLLPARVLHLLAGLARVVGKNFHSKPEIEYVR